MTTVSQAEFAQLLGVSRPYISKLIGNNTLALDADGRLDLQAAVDALKVAASPGHQRRASGENDSPLMRQIRDSALLASANADADEPVTFQQSRAQRERYAALNEKLKFQTAARQLLPASDVEKTIGEAFKALAQTLDSLPDTLERDCALPPNAVIAAQRAIDAARETLYSMLIESLAAAP